MSKYLSDEWRRIKDGLAVKFITEVQYQLTEGDYSAFRQANEMILVVRKYKVCHYVSCALYASGKYKHGTHIYCRRMHEFSVCAETRPMERANYKELSGAPDPIVTLATIHAAYDKSGQTVGNPYLVSPCEKCLRLLGQLSPDCLIITDLDGQGRLAKIPLEAVEFFRHPSYHKSE